MVDKVRLQSDAAAPIPEPVSLGLVGLGLLAFGCNRRRKA
ncbi:MAG: PEP-CTERM sorting domain-containing protein [Candidatus Accumulibacter phosphatis]